MKPIRMKMTQLDNLKYIESVLSYYDQIKVKEIIDSKQSGTYVFCPFAIHLYLFQPLLAQSFEMLIWN